MIQKERLAWDRVRSKLSRDEKVQSEFERFLERCSDLDIDYWLDHLDQSDYSMADWAEALLNFDGWLECGGYAARPFRAMVGYVHCCTLTNPPGTRFPELGVVVIQSLKEYGFDAAADSQK